MTVDIETDSRNGSPLLGEPNYISWCDRGAGYGIKSDNLTKWLIEYFLIKHRDRWILYAHNAFNFDFKRINWEWLAELGFCADFLTGNDGSIKSITLEKDGYQWYIRDSYLLIPMTLDKATKTFSPETLKIKRKVSFEFKVFDPDDKEETEYAIQDSVALYHTIETVDKLLLKLFGVSIHHGATLPSIAFRAFRQQLERGERQVKRKGVIIKEKIPGEEFEGISYQVAHAARESYHGGQTIAFKTGLFTDVISLDANSMYAHCMMNWELPTGGVTHFIGLPKNINPNRCLCLAIVHIDNGVFPLLKTKDKNRHVGNFSGTVSGWYWLFELEKQRELGGTFEVIESYVWKETTDCAKRFAAMCREFRMMDYFGAMGAIAKLIGNSTYGKFAQMVAAAFLVLSKEEPEGGIPFYEPTTGKVIKSVWYVPSRPNFSADLTHWASFITAKARMVLTDAIQKIGFDRIIYCDTDSIFFERKYLDSVLSIMGNEYGQFKIEKGSAERGIIFRAIAPKAYIYPDEDGGFVYKNKGIPAKSISTNITVSGKVSYIQSNALSQMLKNGKKYGQTSSRKLATEKSTTNGKIERGVWIPSPCQVRGIDKIRGMENNPSYISTRYDRLVAEYSGRE